MAALAEESSSIQSLRDALKTSAKRNIKEIPAEEWLQQCDAIDESQLQRYLTARDSNIQEAATLGLRAEEWRWKWKPTTITPDDISTSLPSGCWRFAGFSKDKRPIVLIDAGLWRPGDYSLEEYIRYVSWFIEGQIIRMEGDVTKHIVIFDMGGFSLWHNDLRKVHQLVTITQTCYPERLSLAALVNVPTLFLGVWAVIKPWLDPETLAKVHLFGGSESQKEAAKVLLTEIIDSDTLLEQYGGTTATNFPRPTAKPEKGDDYPGGSGTMEEAVGALAGAGGGGEGGGGGDEAAELEKQKQEAAEIEGEEPASSRSRAASSTM